MTDSRENILNRIGQSLNRIEKVSDIDEAFATLTRHRRIPIQPPLTQTVVETFIHAASDSAANVHTISDLDGFAPWLEQQTGQRPGIVLSPNAQELSARLSAFSISDNSEKPNNWGVVRAFAGIAETGTIVSFSEDCPAGILFLVERLIVILNVNDIVAYQEDVWKKLRQGFNKNLPRTVNLITGPSRTADVEQTIQLGAHGPRWVDYVLMSE